VCLNIRSARTPGPSGGVPHSGGGFPAVRREIPNAESATEMTGVALLGFGL